MRKRVERSEEDLGERLKDFQTLEEDKWGKNSQRLLDLKELIHVEHDRLHLNLYEFTKSAESRFKEIYTERLPRLEQFHEHHSNNQTSF